MRLSNLTYLCGLSLLLCANGYAFGQAKCMTNGQWYPYDSIECAPNDKKESMRKNSEAKAKPDAEFEALKLKLYSELSVYPGGEQGVTEKRQDIRSLIVQRQALGLSTAELYRELAALEVIEMEINFARFKIKFENDERKIEREYGPRAR